ncbi:GntR family transcriptional regulator [Chthonobacter albigriseus]|uniref:GntR family transcriptional regulator n=1 Tax=Chthonobacter albigriseus TaxID=1683161 RepID=UPI0015EEE5B4|nr:GntR family transcriptional regulator [Chthonobacter albigriseus]
MRNEPDLADHIPREHAPLRRRLVTTLRRLVESGDLPAGRQLVEKDLCERFGVSRTVLRESLRELEVDGLLTPGRRGLVVSTIDRTEAENVYAVRGALEALAAREFCARAEAMDVQALRTALDRLKAAYAADLVADILAAKQHFYAALLAGARNPVTTELLGRLTARTGLLRGRSLADRNRRVASLAEIEALTEALAARDAARAAELAARHVSAAAKAALSTFDPAPKRHEESFQ